MRSNERNIQARDALRRATIFALKIESVDRRRNETVAPWGNANFPGGEARRAESDCGFTRNVQKIYSEPGAIAREELLRPNLPDTRLSETWTAVSSRRGFRGSKIFLGNCTRELQKIRMRSGDQSPFTQTPLHGFALAESRRLQFPCFGHGDMI
jgi:hypothetical protein